MSTPLSIPPSANQRVPPSRPVTSLATASPIHSTAPLPVQQQQAGPSFSLSPTEENQRILRAHQQAASPSQRPAPPRPPLPALQVDTGPQQNASATAARLPGQTQASVRGLSQGLADQRRQFINSFAGFLKQFDLPMPREIFNGERDGAVKLGDSWLEMVDLFMMVMRNQGIANVGH